MDIRALPVPQWFECSDGEQLAYRTYGARVGLQLVLIHGSACCGDQFSKLARAIARQGLATVHALKGFNIVALDMRGHGLNPRTPAQWRDPVDDIGEFVRALKGHAPGNRVVVGGHSAGGRLVCRVAQSFGNEPAACEDVAGWLLLAPCLATDSTSASPVFDSWISRIHRMRLTGAITGHLLRNNRFNHAAALPDPRAVRQGAFDAIAAFDPGSRREARKIPGEQPVLLVCGSDDQCFCPEHYPDALHAVAPHAEMLVMPGLGHWDILANPRIGTACAYWLEAHFDQDIEFQPENSYIEVGPSLMT